MRRFLAYLVALLLVLPLRGQDFDALGTKLEEYLASMETMTAAEKASECDFLISSCRDSLVRDFVAGKLYDHYFNSALMGDEEVAIHLIDSWFVPGKVSFADPLLLFNARLWADANRSSLLGKEAPELVLESPGGEIVRPLESSAGRYKVFFFYDTSCATCKMETLYIKRFLSENTFPLDFYGIYVGTDEASWARYRAMNLSGEGIIHLWDPSSSEDLPHKYGVISTPRMFLIGPEGKILGRGLDTRSLETLLGTLSGPYTYGNPEAKALFDTLFSMGGEPEDVENVARFLSEDSLEKGDTLLFSHLAGELLYWLSSKKTPGFREGTRLFIEKYLSRVPLDPEISALASLMEDLLSKAPVGEKVPAIQVHGTLLRKGCLLRKARKEGIYALSRKGLKFIVFHTSGCGDCERILSEAEALSSKGTNILLVDMDQLFSSYPEEADAAFRSFDLSALPMVISLDGKATVTGKYLDSLSFPQE